MTGKSEYSVHPSVLMLQKMESGLTVKTGKSMEQWLALVKKSGLKTEQERREWLKTKHGLGGNHASWIAERAEGKDLDLASAESYLKVAGQYVDTMFSGPKAGLRPIYDALLKLGKGIAKDVKVCPCTTIVPFYRSHVIAQIKPSTRTRIDMGFALQDTKANGRLIDTGGYAKKDRITHVIPITSLSDIDVEVKRWFQKAYEMDA